MKKFKKIIALSLALAMGVSLCACGGGEDATTEATTEAVTDAPTEETDATTEAPADPTEGIATDGDPIYVYSWNTELQDRLKYFFEKYPQFESRVEYVSMGLDGTDPAYREKIDALIDAGPDGDQYPSIIAADNDMALNFIQNPKTVTMESIGITDADYADAYQFTKDYATHDGALKALAWQAAPGCFLYRTDIAEEVLGAKDRDTVQAAVADWDKFFETAETMKGKGYKMLSSPQDVKYVLSGQRTQPWVDADDKLIVDSWVTEYLETAKKLYDGDYTNKTDAWSEAWNADFDGNVFGWFACTWFVPWVAEGNTKEHTGDFDIVEGPAAYRWGGTYLSVTEGCPDTKLAALILKGLCTDPEIMEKLAIGSKDYINNKTAVAKIIDEGTAANPYLGGADPYPIFAAMADGVNAANSTPYDAIFNGYVDAAGQSYNTGAAASVEDAIAEVKKKVSDAYSYITVE